MVGSMLDALLLIPSLSLFNPDPDVRLVRYGSRGGFGSTSGLDLLQKLLGLLEERKQGHAWGHEWLQ